MKKFSKGKAVKAKKTRGRELRDNSMRTKAQKGKINRWAQSSSKQSKKGRKELQGGMK